MVKPKRNVSFSNEFFKIYLSDFSSRQLSLPHAFGIQFNGKDQTLPKNATLKYGNTKTWDVGFVKKEGVWIIEHGWKIFASYHSLVDGDFLIFKYDGSSEFEVELYGKNGLKNEDRGLENRARIHVKEEQETEEEFIGSRPSSGYKQKNSDTETRRTRLQGLETEEEFIGKNGLKNEDRGLENRARIHVKEEQETEEEFIGTRPSSGYKQENSNTETRRTRSQGLFGKSGPKVEKLGESKGAKATSSVRHKVPCFVMNITRTTRYVRIPKTFMKEHNIKVPKEIKLRDESGKLWPVQASHWDNGYTVLTSGFSEFCRMNKLSARDQCVFTFIRAKGNLCNVIQVQFARQSLKTQKHGRTWKSKA